MSGQQQTVGTPSDVDDKAKRLQHAFDYWAKKYPESFSEVAPNLLLEAVKRSEDKVELDKLESWLIDELPREDFQVELKPPARSPPLRSDFKPVALDLARYGDKNAAWLNTLNDRFIVREKLDESGTDHRRWRRAIRDQYIILGVIASEPDGVNQGRLVRILGIPVNEEASRKYAANIVRAAKIALSRYANEAGIEGGLFKQAKGHGVNRVYAFRDESMRKLTYKWVQSLSAGELIPEPLGGSQD